MKRVLAALMALCLLPWVARAEADPVDIPPPEDVVGESVEEEAGELDAFELDLPPEEEPPAEEPMPLSEPPAFSAENGSYGVDLSSRGYGSLNPFTGAGLAGESTWYCWGRAYEKCGIRLGWDGMTADAPADWYAHALDRAANGGAKFSAGDAPREDAVAVYSDRVVFIERLMGDVACVTECEGFAGPLAYNEREIDLSADPAIGYIYLRFTASGGQCGDGVTWELASDRTLEIRGNGPMWDYADSPWRADAIDTVVVREGVTAIGAGAFEGVQMKNLVVADSVTEIGSRAFKDCARLKRVTLPKGLTVLPPQVFEDCWRLSGLDLPESLVEIADGAFARTALTSLYLPAGLLRLHPHALQECWTLGEIAVEPGGAAYCSIDNAVYTGDGATLVYSAPARTGRFTVPAGVRTIGESAFACSGLTELVLPEGLESIADDAFKDAQALTRINLPASLRHIPEDLGAGTTAVQAVYGTPGHEYCRVQDARYHAGGAVDSYVVTADASLTDATLYTGEQLLLTGKGFTSSQPDVATVSGGNRVTALSAGTADITANGHALRLTVADPYTPTRMEIVTPDGTLLTMDSTLPMRVKLWPETAAADITWHSSDTTVATVDARGVVNPLSEGFTTLTATTANGLSASSTVEVINPYKCREVLLDRGGLVLLDIHGTLQLNTALVPPSARTTLTWYSSRESVAQVSQSGLVTPTGRGTATITVTTANGRSASVQVKVSDLYTPVKVKLNVSGTVKLRVGETVYLEAGLSPATAEASLHWSTSDSSVAGGTCRDRNAEIKALAPGTTTITVTTDNGKTARVRIKVVK